MNVELWSAIPIGVGILGAIVGVKGFLANTTVSRDHSKLNERLSAAETSLIRVAADLSKASNDLAAIQNQLASSSGNNATVAQRHIDCAKERARHEADFEARLRVLERDTTVTTLAKQITELTGQLATQVAELSGDIESMRVATLKDAAHIEAVIENKVNRMNRA